MAGSRLGARPERQQRAIDLLAQRRVVVVGDQHEIAGRSGDEVPGDGAVRSFVSVASTPVATTSRSSGAVTRTS